MLSYVYAGAIPRYWVGATNSNWNTASNWNTVSGGGGATGLPGTGDDVIFDGNGLVDCNINANISVATITVLVGYTKTISQANTRTITTTGAVSWSGGTFTGGNSNISVAGTFTLSGTAFTSTSATLGIGNNFSFTSGSFTHNNGTVSFDFSINSGGNNITVSNSSSITFNNVTTVPFYRNLNLNNSFIVNGNLTLSGSGAGNPSVAVNISSGQTITVNGTLSTTGAGNVSINTGTIDTKGDITLSNTSAIAGNGTVSITGNGAQLLTGSGTVAQGGLPNVTINKLSGTLTLASYITVYGPSWNYISGTIAPGTSTINFYNTDASVTTFTIAGTHTLYDVVFRGNYLTPTHTVSNDLTTNSLTLDGTSTCVVAVTSSITVGGTLTYSGGGNITLNSGTVNVKGNVVNNSTLAANNGGTASFVINGTGAQNISGTSVIDRGAYPPFYINKSSGTVSFSGFLTFYNGFTWQAGSVNSGTSTCVFINSVAQSQSVSASAAGMSFYNVIFEQPDYGWTKLLTDISVSGDFTIAASSGICTNNHNISIGGNFTSLNTTATSNFAIVGTNPSPGTTTPNTNTFTFNGFGQQTITMNNPNATGNRAFFYNLVINNNAARSSNDDITLADILPVTNSVTFTNGRMLTTSTKYLRVMNGASANTGTTTSYVNGPMNYDMAVNGSTRTLNFPIGDGSNWRYASLSVRHSAATSYTYTAQVTHSSASALGYTVPGTISYVSNVRYTTIDRTVTSSGAAASSTNLVVASPNNPVITMRYSTDDQVGDFANLTIAKTTGSGTPWIDLLGSATANTTGTITSTSTTAFIGFSKFCLANKSAGTNSLPIELVSFEARPKNGNVLLTWVTASETNSDHFEVLRSKNGTDWVAIGNVKAAGTTNEQHNYSFEDGSAFQGSSYYRLKQVDVDNKFENFTVMARMPFTSIVVYPNPASDKVVIEGEDLDSREISLMNQMGSDMTSYVRISQPDKNTMIIDISSLPQQTYILKGKNVSTMLYKQ
ncbi:hypothetical protein WSM22_33450 [Cytophagales bacterium WSM2-2]|nr:hypothetical protein WSM22_33450 [Cytophagales bacterium WSM2-2]